jgi:peptidyl-prolyl cis-trans isomerase C
MTTLFVAEPKQVDPPADIRVNGASISRSDIDREAQHHPSQSARASWRAAATALVVRELLLQEARAAGIGPEPLRDAAGRRETEEDALIRGLLQRDVDRMEPTEGEARRYYDAHPDRFASPELVEARHILLAASAAEPARYERARRQATALAAVLAGNPACFADLARQHSDCASAGNGGWLGQLDPRDTTPEFAAALARLAEGETTCEPVAARYGFHLVRLERRIEASRLPFEAVAGEIAALLRARAFRLAAAGYVASLASRAEIMGVELMHPAGPLWRARAGLA